MADSFASYDKYRISFDGANAATSATDALGHTLTFNGSAALSTAAWKYGTASLNVPSGAGNYVSAANSSDLDLGTGDFCIDGWFRQNSSGSQRYFSINDGGVEALSLSVLSTRVMLYINNSVPLDVTTSAWDVASALSVFHHVAVTRSSGVVRVYLNGSKIAQVTFSSAINFSATTVLFIGASGAGAGMNGYVDQFRLTKGAARWSGDAFIPPVDNFDSAESAVSTTSLGTRTKQVSAYGAYYHDSLISSVNDAIVALGWTLYDVVYKNTVTCVYRCLNYDASSYKYVAFVWDRHRMRVTQISMESWDQTTKTATNEAFNNLRTFGVHGYALQNCDVIIYGSANHLGMMTYLQGSPSLWSMCVEMEREAAEDVAGGVPCWGMMYADTCLTVGHGSAGYAFIFLPRAKDGTTGITAATNQSILYNFGSFGTFGYTASSQKAGDMINNGNTTYRTFGYGWDTSKKQISHFRIAKFSGSTDTPVTTYGRVRGMKFCPPLGAAAMDRVQVSIDSDMWFSSSGTPTDHWVLPPSRIDQYWLSGLTSTFPDVSAFATGQVINEIAYTGQYVYIATNANGVYRLDTSSGTASAVSGTSGQIMDIAFDGRYVYAATSTGVAQIDTSNGDSVVNVTVGTGGTQSLAISLRGQLICAQRTAATSMSAYRIDIPSMGNLSSAITIPSTTTASPVASMCFDDTGAVCAYAMGNVTTLADNRVGKIDPFALSAATSYTFGGVNSNYGVSWNQQFFCASGHLAGASPTSTSYTMNAGVTAVQNSHFATSVSPVNTVASPTARAYTEKGYGGTWLTCGSNASAVQHLITFGGVAPYGAQNLPGNTQFGNNSSTASTGMRSIKVTGNQVFGAGHDNTLYLAKNMFYRGYSTNTSYASMLMPK